MRQGRAACSAHWQLSLTAQCPTTVLQWTVKNFTKLTEKEYSQNFEIGTHIWYVPAVAWQQGQQ